MATLKSIKTRIGSVKNTQKITKTMKMVSAAKLRRAQEAVVGSRPYAQTLGDIIANIVAKSSTKQSHPLFVARSEVKKVKILLFTSNRGLCASFNSALLRKNSEFLQELRSQNIDVTLHVIGKKGREFLNAKGFPIHEFSLEWADRLPFAQAFEIAKGLIAQFENRQFDEYYLVYNKFESALRQVPTFSKLLPLAVEHKEETYGMDYLYEPQKTEILEGLLPKYIATQIYKAHLESLASELGARMSAMDSATKNASDMIGKLTLAYNRLRQAAITTELMDIVNGAESVK